MTAELRTAETDAHPVELDAGPFKQRLLLALLLCRCNSVVLVEQLIDTLWWDGPPRTAHKNIQVYISHLRKLLSADGQPSRLRYRPPGYQLVLAPAEVDALRFEDLSRAGRLALRRGDARTAAESMRQALGLWRGPALADLQLSPALREEAARLDDRRLSAYEDWFEAELLLGNHAEVLEQIEGVVRAHPLRERLRSHQLTALYRGGRQAEALAEYDNHRQLLAAELGLDPSPALRRLYQNILSGHPTLNAPPPAGVTGGGVPGAGSPAGAGLAGTVSLAVPAAVPSPDTGDPEVVAHAAGVPPAQPRRSGLPRGPATSPDGKTCSARSWPTSASGRSLARSAATGLKPSRSAVTGPVTAAGTATRATCDASPPSSGRPDRAPARSRCRRRTRWPRGSVTARSCCRCGTRRARRGRPASWSTTCSAASTRVRPRPATGAPCSGAGWPTCSCC
jgi:DNA-binding SARP family transcriptional activator